MTSSPAGASIRLLFGFVRGTKTALTSAAATRSKAIEAHRTSEGRGAHIRRTGTYAVLCRRVAAPGSSTSRIRGR
jgi:hypothetical protein